MSLRFGSGRLATYFLICSCTFICSAPPLRARDYTTLILLSLARAGGPGGIDLSAQKESQIFCPALVDVEVDLRNASVREPFCARIGDYADDGGPVRLLGPQSDTLRT